MDTFSNKIENRCVILYNAADAVRFSVLVQNSISHLDLWISENSTSEIVQPNSCNSGTFNSHTFVNTQEKCRKILTPSRSLLYTLHLDLHRKRECCLKSDQEVYLFSRDPTLQHIRKIIVSGGFYYEILLDFIEYALTVSEHKLKILGLMLKIPFLKKYFFDNLNIVNNFVDFFYPDNTDSVLLKDFIKNFHLARWMTSNEKPEVLTYLLQKARFYGRDLEEEGYPLEETLYMCISTRFLLNISPMLNYIDTIKFSFESIDWYIHEISLMRPELYEEEVTERVKGMHPERICLMLITLWIFLLSSEQPLEQSEASSMTLRLLWNSTHHAGISFKEMRKAFGEDLCEKELLDMYDFYNNCMDKNDTNGAPRSLQHFSRANIRKRLSQNKIWIPDGIKQLGLPKSLQAFLNLEK